MPPTASYTCRVPRRRYALHIVGIIFLSYLFLNWHSVWIEVTAGFSDERRYLFDIQAADPEVSQSRTEHRTLSLSPIHSYTLPGAREDLTPTAYVLILTPLMDAASYFNSYFSNLSSLEYPKELISLGFLVSTTTDDGQQDSTLLALQPYISFLKATSSYRRITVLQQASQPLGYTQDGRHAYEVQESRRKVLAQCRNALLSSTLMDESWVLWLDVDVIEYSPDLLLNLMRLDKDVVAPNCFRSEHGWLTTRSVPYDRNNWFETTESMAIQRVLDGDEFLFEGYGGDHSTYRQSMADLDSHVHTLVPLDGVGGTFTLVKAVVHRAGINFPTHPVDHAIETEGFAKWAKQEGFSVFGAPNLIVRHA